METTAKPNLAQQLRDRLAKMKAIALQALGAGPFGTGESRKDYEARIMGDEGAWTNMNDRNRSILPR